MWERLFAEDWSNTACEGYMLMAMDAAGVDQETQMKVVGQLHAIFDQYSLDDAEDYYRKVVCF